MSHEDALRKKEAREELVRIKAPIDTVLLDEISQGINRLIKHTEAQVPEAVKDEIELTVNGNNPVPMQPRNSHPPYFQATVFIDGPDPTYVWLNEIPNSYEAPLNAGDHLDIDTKEAKIEALWFACVGSTNTSHIRIHLLK